MQNSRRARKLPFLRRRKRHVTDDDADDEFAPGPFARRARPPGPPENTAARTCVREYSTKHIVFLKQDVLFKMSLLTT